MDSHVLMKELISDHTWLKVHLCASLLIISKNAWIF